MCVCARTRSVDRALRRTGGPLRAKLTRPAGRDRERAGAPAQITQGLVPAASRPSAARVAGPWAGGGSESGGGGSESACSRQGPHASSRIPRPRAGPRIAGRAGDEPEPAAGANHAAATVGRTLEPLSAVLSGAEQTGPPDGGPARVARHGRAGAGRARRGQSDETKRLDRTGQQRRTGLPGLGHGGP